MAERNSKAGSARRLIRSAIESKGCLRNKVAHEAPLASEGDGAVGDSALPLRRENGKRRRGTCCCTLKLDVRGSEDAFIERGYTRRSHYLRRKPGNHSSTRWI